MKLLLTSEGLSTPAIKSEFVKLVGKPIHEITVAFIPTAGDPEEDKSFIEQAIQELRLLGDTKMKEWELRGVKKVDIVDLKNFAHQNLEKKLTQYDVLFVNGGNTFYLLHWVIQSGFRDILLKLLADGKVYVGVSAGSIIAGPDIELANWKNVDEPPTTQPKNLNALNLVPFYIFPHYSEKWQQLVEEKRNTLNNKLICLNNQQAISVIDDEYKII